MGTPHQQMNHQGHNRLFLAAVSMLLLPFTLRKLQSTRQEMLKIHTEQCWASSYGWAGLRAPLACLCSRPTEVIDR